MHHLRTAIKIRTIAPESYRRAQQQ